MTPAPVTVTAAEKRRQDMARSLWMARFGDMRGWTDTEPNWALTEADRIIASNDAQVEALTPAPGRDDTTAAGEPATESREHWNPALDDPTAGRDELREQIAAALGCKKRRLHGGTGRYEDTCNAHVGAGWPCRRLAAVMEPVDTWIAAHTEQVAALTAERDHATDVVNMMDAAHDEATEETETLRAAVARVRARLDECTLGGPRRNPLAGIVDDLRAALDPPTDGT